MHSTWQVKIKGGISIALVMALLMTSVVSAARPVSMTAPVNGEIVSGIYVVRGTGSGTAVEVTIDSGAWMRASGTKSWTYSWNTTTYSEGSHVVSARYIGSSSIVSATVTVDNIPDGPRQPVAGEVLINEFVAANSVTQTSEWVELYNTTSETLTIGSMYIDDIAAGGGSPMQIPAGTTLDAGSYYVMTFSSYLNNTGDDVRFLDDDGVTIYDAYTYATATYDMSWCRKPDGGSWSALECSPTQGGTNSPPLDPGTWTPGTLEVHILNVGQGESQLIIGPSGKTMLIDVYEPSWNTNQGATWVAGEIRRITGSEHLDYVMATHWHLDHMGYPGYGGIWSLLEQQGITADVLIDRDGGTWVDANHDGICDPDLEIVYHNAGTTSGTASNWACWATDPTTIGGQIRQLAQPGSTTQIDLGIADGVTVKVVQVDAQGVMMADGITPVQGDHTLDALPPSENDYSITVWLNWGMFDFVSGGDTDGEYATSEFAYVYDDVESGVAASIAQEVEVIAVNHHGSAHSTNASYVTTLNPDVAIYSVGSTNTYGHPDQVTLDRLYTNGTKQYFTQIGDATRSYYDAVIVDGNVVVQVTDGTNYTVNGDSYVATNPGGGPTEPRVPVIGEVLLNEFLPAPQTLFTTEWVELYNTTADRLDIGGMWIDDLLNGGGAPKQIPTGTILEPGGYYFMEMSNYLNNTGDDVRLLGTNGSTLFDTYTYGSAPYDLSFCRLPDGGVWTSNCTATKGLPNQ
ncbi:MAG: lamin tail domain-containing protein [Anaerolineaceae bacterium]